MPAPRSSKKTTPSWVCTLPLAVLPSQEGVLLSRLEAARQFYNACLGEAVRRVQLIRQSKDFNLACSLKPSNPQRKVLFKGAREKYEFSDYAIQACGTRIRHSWIADHIDAHTGQKLATRAFNAAQIVLFGKAKKVRFKGKHQLDSVEGKANTAGIRWQNECVEWSGLKLKAIINNNDPVLLHGLNSRVKYVRIVRRKYNGKNLFYAQLVCEGKPYQKPKNKIGKGNVGIDIGPSTIAVVGDGIASLNQFADQLQFKDKKIRKLQRKMERSRRANNPEKYNANGTIKNCVCGVLAQRDLYSAFLAKHIDHATMSLQVSQVLSAWQSVEPRLMVAWREATQQQPATGRLLPSSFGSCPEEELVAIEVLHKMFKIQDVVSFDREPGRGHSRSLEPGSGGTP